MGYVHNTHMAMRTPLQDVVPTVGTWAMAVASNVWSLDKTAAANTSILQVPLLVPQNSQIAAGAKLTTIDVYYINGTANLTAMSAKVYKTTLPAQAGSIAAAEIASTSTFVLTQTQNKVTITITTPVYIGEDEDVFVELTIQSAAGSVVKLQGVVANYTLRI